MAPFVEIEKLSRRFGALRALDDLSLSISKGEWVAVTGPSGSGKTTLLNILSGLDRATSGEARVGGVDLASLSARELAHYRQQTVGLVFQQFHLIPYLTALENVMLAQYVHSMTDKAEAEEALLRVGLGERLSHLPSQLSGGEQQRVCIARALINQPPLILADEPTGNLDAANEAVVMSILADLHRKGHTLILVTHDPSIAARAGREVRLEHGRLAAAVEEPGDLELVRRVRLAEVLLERTLSRRAAGECGQVAPVAAGFEDQVCAFLDHPTVCPHGRPIPAGDGCCARASVRDVPQTVEAGA